jgi:hypothetical protein
MPCPQDADLKQMGIYIDKFVKNSNISYFFISHAHRDHLVGLSNTFTNRPHQQIHCTQVTAELIKCQMDGLNDTDFVILEFNKPFKMKNTCITVIPIKAFHCDGSAMFLFCIDNCQDIDNVTILYTGDYRYQPKIHKNNSFFSNVMIDRLYYDDTLDMLKSDLPSYEQTRNEIIDIISNVPESMPIYINASILGFEFILRNVADSLGIKYSLSKGLKNTWRGKQLELLLEGYICNDNIFGKCRYILHHRNKDKNDGKSVYIYPTSTAFLCKQNEYKNKALPLQFQTENITYVWFSNHSNEKENKLFQQLVTPRITNPCKDNLGFLKCLK